MHIFICIYIYTRIYIPLYPSAFSDSCQRLVISDNVFGGRHTTRRTTNVSFPIIYWRNLSTCIPHRTLKLTGLKFDRKSVGHRAVRKRSTVLNFRTTASQKCEAVPRRARI